MKEQVSFEGYHYKIVVFVRESSFLRQKLLVVLAFHHQDSILDGNFFLYIDIIVADVQSLGHPHVATCRYRYCILLLLPHCPYFLQSRLLLHLWV